jgi:hypothetical protein
MKIVTILILFICSLRIGSAQSYNGLFVHADYQALKYSYLQVGVGHHLKNNFLQSSGKNDRYYFSGYTVSYTKNLNNSDWGLAIQYITYSGSYDGPGVFGIEANYKSVQLQNHFGMKPIIGLSFPMWSIAYGYNFDLYREKSQRISQHELVLGLRLRLIKWR